MPGKADKIEKTRRINQVKAWILDDWTTKEIVDHISVAWNISDRQGMTYVSEARDSWADDDGEVVERKRRVKVASLKKLKQSLHDRYKGTPYGMNAILRIEREIIALEGLRVPTKVQLSGDKENPLPIVSAGLPDLSRLSTEELKTIVELSKKAIK